MAGLVAGIAECGSLETDQELAEVAKPVGKQASVSIFPLPPLIITLYPSKLIYANHVQQVCVIKTKRQA